MIQLDGMCSLCGCKGIHACLGPRNLAKELQQSQHDTAGRFNRDKCLVCGEHHNHGNLPCPTMQVTANG